MIDIRSVLFKNVKEVEMEVWENVIISFTIENMGFVTLASPPDIMRNYYRFDTVMHASEKNKICPFCHQPAKFRSTCTSLQNQLGEVVERLLAEPALRLTWLYREYKVKGGGKTNGNNV